MSSTPTFFCCSRWVLGYEKTNCQFSTILGTCDWTDLVDGNIITAFLYKCLAYYSIFADFIIAYIFITVNI